MSKAAELAKMGEVLTNGQIGGRTQYLFIMVQWKLHKEVQVLQVLLWFYL